MFRLIQILYPKSPSVSLEGKVLFGWKIEHQISKMMLNSDGCIDPFLVWELE